MSDNPKNADLMRLERRIAEVKNEINHACKVIAENQPKLEELMREKGNSL